MRLGEGRQVIPTAPWRDDQCASLRLPLHRPWLSRRGTPLLCRLWRYDARAPRDIRTGRTGRWSNRRPFSLALSRGQAPPPTRRPLASPCQSPLVCPTSPSLSRPRSSITCCLPRPALSTSAHRPSPRRSPCRRGPIIVLPGRRINWLPPFLRCQLETTVPRLTVGPRMEGTGMVRTSCPATQWLWPRS